MTRLRQAFGRYENEMLQNIPPLGFGRAADALSLDWLRRLHRSHEPEPGPFTVCTHREDAGTLSYTEIVVTARDIAMNHSPSSPCRNLPLVTGFLPNRP